MIVKKQPYEPVDPQQYQEDLKQKAILSMKKKMDTLGIQASDLALA